MSIYNPYSIDFNKYFLSGIFEMFGGSLDFIINECLEMSEERAKRLKKIKLKKRKRKGLKC